MALQTPVTLFPGTHLLLLLLLELSLHSLHRVPFPREVHERERNKIKGNRGKKYYLIMLKGAGGR